MNIEKYQEFANYLRVLVEGERDQCVIDKNLLLTAAAAIDELSSRVVMAHPPFHIRKISTLSASSVSK
ncbi:hypothetical protein GV764_01895 [Atlantibacter hermannii]|uniref:hypothetical protein n=1 Tax=Atlantibacter hermannii TaxID=565 RepID=UPI00137848CC|nr:hypothetical protein [Atlantibacter hermannii]NBC97774.1 hypothetical protein [Atlantibacter hermannii]